MLEEKALPPHSNDDIPIYKTIIWLLGIIGILSIGGAIALTVLGKPIPESIVALGSASVGALAGLLAPSPTN